MVGVGGGGLENSSCWRAGSTWSTAGYCSSSDRGISARQQRHMFSVKSLFSLLSSPHVFLKQPSRKVICVITDLGTELQNFFFFFCLKSLFSHPEIKRTGFFLAGEQHSCQIARVWNRLRVTPQTVPPPKQSKQESEATKLAKTKQSY